MMGVDDPRAAQRSHQTWRERMRRMAAQPTIGAQRTDPQSTRFLDHTAKATKRDQLAVDLSGQGTRQLEWITLTTTK
jgi:plasmid stabilization system protein ParE